MADGSSMASSSRGNRNGPPKRCVGRGLLPVVVGISQLQLLFTWRGHYVALVITREMMKTCLVPRKVYRVSNVKIEAERAKVQHDKRSVFLLA